MHFHLSHIYIYIYRPIFALISKAWIVDLKLSPARLGLGGRAGRDAVLQAYGRGMFIEVFTICEILGYCIGFRVWDLEFGAVSL